VNEERPYAPAADLPRALRELSAFMDCPLTAAVAWNKLLLVHLSMFLVGYLLPAPAPRIDPPSGSR
jgi:hypothetical protein